MSGQEKDAFAALRCAIEIFVAIVGNNPADILAGVRREKTDFRELTPERSKHLTHDFSSLRCGFLGKCNGEITHAHATKFSVQEVDELSQGNAHQTRQGTRKRPDRLYYTPRQRVFESVPHQAKRDRITGDFSLSMNRWRDGRDARPAGGDAPRSIVH